MIIPKRPTPPRGATIAWALMIALGPTSRAYAWGDLGHRTIAAIAEHRFAPSTKVTVDLLIASSDLLATPNCPVRSLGDASIWADCVRSLYRPLYARSSPWHYVDVPLCGPFDLPRACPDGQCVTAQLDRWRKVLGDRAQPLRSRVEALMWVAHLTGDLHQPLHVTDNGDRGGNQVAVEFEGRTGGDYNLHGIWDRDLAERTIENAGGKEAFVRRAPASSVETRVSSASIASWARESWDLGRSVVYGALPVRPVCATPTDGIVHIDRRYASAAEPVVRLQLDRAGTRLATLLDQSLGGVGH